MSAADPRYAIYFAPHCGDPVWRFGSMWLGRSVEGVPVPPAPEKQANGGHVSRQCFLENQPSGRKLRKIPFEGLAFRRGIIRIKSEQMREEVSGGRFPPRRRRRGNKAPIQPTGEVRPASGSRAWAQAQSGAQTAPARNARGRARGQARDTRETGSRRAGPGGGANAAICNVRRVRRGGAGERSEDGRKGETMAKTGNRTEDPERRPPDHDET